MLTGRRALRLMAKTLPWAIAFAWLGKALETRAGMRRLTDIARGPLPQLHDEGAHPPQLSVVVAACNEEQAIEATVRSLLASRGLSVEVVAVDDRSTDATGAILDRLGAAYDRQRFRVLHVMHLPEGWLGKPHALTCGAAETQADWLLFTDGDIQFREDALARALAYAARHQVDHLILTATPIARSLGERVVLTAIPVLAAWALRIWKVNDPQARETLGVGSFTLVRRAAYEAVGGWAAVRFEVLEDLRLGWELKRRQGLRQHVVLGPQLLRLHWAAGALGLARNLGKNGFAAFQYSVPRVLLGTAGMTMLVFAPLLGWLLPGRLGRHARWAVVPYAAAVWLLAATPSRRYKEPAWPILFLPAGAVLLLYGVLRSAVLTLARDGVEWRGTRYPLAQLRAAAGPLR